MAYSMDMAWVAIFAIALYIYGSVPIAYIAVRRTTGQKLFEKGTKNVGVANAFRVGGLWAGFAAVAGEASKGLLAVAASYMFFGYNLDVSLILIGSAVIGSNFPVFLRFRGGMGATILIWSLMVVTPVSILILLALLPVLMFVTKKPRVSVISVYLLSPVIFYLVTGEMSLVVFGICVGVLYALRYSEEREEFSHGGGARKTFADALSGKTKIRPPAP